jgi:hypothetical protein
MLRAINKNVQLRHVNANSKREDHLSIQRNILPSIALVCSVFSPLSAVRILVVAQPHWMQI